MQCKLFKNKGEDFMLKSIRKFFSMILPICMLVTTAPCIISTAEGKTVDFSIVNSDNVEFRVSEDRKTVGFFYNDEPSAYSLQSGEGNNGPIATLLSANNNVTFSKNKMLDSGFTATSSDGANFTLKLKVTDDAKKQGWMGDILSESKLSNSYGQTTSYDVTNDDVRDGLNISLKKGKYIEIEKPSGDFDENEVNSTISVNYEDEYLYFTEENGYTLAVPGEDGASDGQDSGLKVTVEDEAPFTCDRNICEENGIIIDSDDSEKFKFYELKGTGTCKLRFKDNRKGIWLAGTDGSECGYVEVSTYANDKDRANDIIMGEREIVKAGEYYYSDAGESAIVHAKFVPYNGYMTDDSGMGSVALDDDALKKLGDGEKNANEEHYLVFIVNNAVNIKNFKDFFKEKIPEGEASSDTNLKTVEVEKTASGKIYSANATIGVEVATSKWVKHTIGEDYLIQEFSILEISIFEKFDKTSGSFTVEETEDFVTITLTLNEEAKEKLKELMNEGGTFKVVRNHKGEITFLPDEDVNFDLEKGTITFRSNKFSTYGFYVVSKKDENDVITNNVVAANNLKTGEDASYLTFLGVLLVTGGWLFILSKRKNKILK